MTDKDLKQHCKKIAEICEDWPDWKKAVLGQTCGGGYENLPGDDGCGWPPEEGVDTPVCGLLYPDGKLRTFTHPLDGDMWFYKMQHEGVNVRLVVDDELRALLNGEGE